MARTALLFVGLAALGGLRSQDDQRDNVTRTDGKVVQGRVVEPFAATEIVVLQGGRRVRIPRAEVATMDLVGDRLAAFCERRVRQKDSRKAQSFLVDHAKVQGLAGMARLQAMWLALQDDDEAAHTFLGHQKGPKGWLWEHDGKKHTREQLELVLQKQPLRLVGERFALTCTAGLATNVGALLDLESAGAHWFARFGKDLGLAEVLQPIEVHAARNVDEFQKWGFRPLPYFVPPPHGDVARTFYSGPQPVRPERLFFVGAQGLLYRTLIGEANGRDDRDRVCAWLEIGLGMWLENSMQGPNGMAAPTEPRGLDVQSLQALGRGYRLTHLLHLPMYGSYYLTDDTATATNWSAATTFVAWLLEPDNQPVTREPFLKFVRTALKERKGDSSSAFDKAMGLRVEDLDEPWRKWLAKKAGY
ncbi:MAG: hypothetical protein JNK15_11385 [Planctomycetes bacterium]|nr:hypothetical protein [Planctomycetota bacterium]